MRIQLKRGRDGPSTLACVRGDGSRTWAKVHPFFPRHDLTHYAVESVLGLREAFFGLVASGWELDDFALPGAARRLPADALFAEHVVGLLDREGALREPLMAGAFNEALRAAFDGGMAHPALPVSREQLERIRALRDALVVRWGAVVPGESLELAFPEDLGSLS
jgi:hypothetical protein